MGKSLGDYTKDFSWLEVRQKGAACEYRCGTCSVREAKNKFSDWCVQKVGFQRSDLTDHQKTADKNPALHGNAKLTPQEMWATAKEKTTQQAQTKLEERRRLRCLSSTSLWFWDQRKSPCISRRPSLLGASGTAWPVRAVGVRRTTPGPSPLLPRTCRGRC